MATSTAQTFDVGDVVRLKANFTDTGGDPLDPSAVTFIYETPAGGTTTSTGTHPSTGFYYIDVISTGAGVYEWRVYSTGVGRAAGESWFRIREQRVT